MHGDVRLGGIVWTFAFALIVLAVFLSLFVMIDSLRRMNRHDQPGPREPLWLYAIGSVLYLFVLLLVQVLPATTLFSASVVVLAPFSLALGVAYLLRVVFPKA